MSKELKDQDRLAYAIGYLLGQDMKSKGFTELPMSSVTLGLEHSLNGGEALIPPEESGKLFQEAYIQNQKNICLQNKKIAKDYGDFLVKEHGYISHGSGIVYKQLSEGHGVYPTVEDKVCIRYNGTFLDKTPFDNSEAFEAGVELELSRSLPGWAILLTEMKPGEKRMALIPSDLAYGDSGVTQWIPPGAGLLYELELISIL